MCGQEASDRIRHSHEVGTRKQENTWSYGVKLAENWLWLTHKQRDAGAIYAGRVVQPKSDRKLH